MVKPGCKPGYRKEFLKIRDSIPKEVQKEKSRLMTQLFIGHEYYNAANVIHAFVSFGSEINTRGIIEDAWQKGKNVVCPITDNKNKRLSNRLVKSWDDFIPGYAQIPEPKSDLPEVEVIEFDIILIPGMAFDKYGFRMGYGGGYYDRFLPQTKAKRIAPVFSEQLIDCVPHCLHDQQVDLIVTEKEIISCDRTIRPECPVKKLNAKDCLEI